MKFEPHAYQNFATEFIKNNKECAVFLDCGLGKTAITLTAIKDMLDCFEIRKVLVVAPLRVARDTWPKEIAKWDHTKSIKYSVVMGDASQRRFALMKDAEIYITNRENLEWLIEEKRNHFDFDMVVLDELSSFKNHRAKRFKALMRIRPTVKRIVGLTGTPASNGLMDLWAEFKTLDCGKHLGRYLTSFRENYFIPDKRNGAIVYSYRLRPGAQERIYDAISDMTISMRSTDHLKMPSLVTNVVKVKMDESEEFLYKGLKKELVVDLDSEKITASNAASLSGKLLQMANGAIYTDSHAINVIHDRKLDALEDLIEAANGKNLLIAYWFQHDLVRISKKLDAMGVNYKKLDTSQSIDDWNEGKLQVGLIHPASAGHGLNLQDGGNTLIWFGLTWSLELYQQTVARLWRQGQKSETVIVHQIVTEDTIDERVLKVLEGKESTQDALLEAVKAEIRR